ncbi:TIGR02452 family protein [Thermobifida halotolerans]|uniref:TIGR02452 family protein n=1 Tax=Thermobifida halotolerans TaxID=483545 RepID=A0A399G718_9ACTN|nr:TIGR02452 family protein [Thermobifida halotolerans]UOE20963.1 TIGR02452 family protein [Thermobifida halotolerans]
MSRMLRDRWQETREAFERGWYEVGGRRVDLSAHLERMHEGTRLYLPGEPGGHVPAAVADTRVEVTGETTLRAVLRLADERGDQVAALNFASARNPGGGVANGAQAQEESLARSSALYDSLVRCPEYYEHHREQRTLLYSDRIIYSPHVPVYRRDDGSWLEEPAVAAFLTAAAPNRRMTERNRPHEAALIPETLRTRAGAVLAVAARHGHTRLVLGAWGCGVFGNRPREVADAFRAHLTGGFAGAFEHVVFAVLDPAGATREAFEPLAEQT